MAHSSQVNDLGESSGPHARKRARNRKKLTQAYLATFWMQRAASRSHFNTKTKTSIQVALRQVLLHECFSGPYGGHENRIECQKANKALNISANFAFLKMIDFNLAGLSTEGVDKVAPWCPWRPQTLAPCGGP